MSSTSALYTGLSGMNANARRLDVIGNNIANANTTAFKSSRMMFGTQFSRTLSIGSQPTTDDGGSDPYQIGQGVLIAGTQRDMSGGSITASGDPRDLAIQGQGFFVVDHFGDPRYTRVGTFRQDAQSNLVTIDGDHVQGYGVDQNFNIVPGALKNINLPVGSLTLAEATKNVQFGGNLKADGAVATQGSSLIFGGSPTAGFGLIPSATVPASPPNLLESTSLLREIADPQAPTSALFAAGQTIRITGAEKGQGLIPVSNFSIGAASTVQDLMTFLSQALDLTTTSGPNPDGKTPGVSLDPLAGKLTVTGNTGTVSDLDIQSSDVKLLDATGSPLRDPFAVDKAAAATGESTRTTFIAYDSLGAPVTTNLSMVLESKDGGGTVWRYYADSPDETGPARTIASGTVRFGTDGQLVAPTSVPITINRAGSGASTPLAFNIDFAAGQDAITSLASNSSAIAATYQDGARMGTLSGFGVGPDGIITGTFTSGITRTLGQVALASFANPEGLIDDGDNNFRAAPNSGPATVGAPGQLGTGQVVSGALEQSNVDLGQEFTNMIVTSTGYSASSRVVRTADELLQQLLVLGR